MRTVRGVRLRWVLAVCCLPLLLGACTREARPLSKETLFTLKRGFLPEELALARGTENQEEVLGEVAVSPSATVYLSDPISRKLMVLSNYGDLLGLFYNPADSLWAKSPDAVEFTPWPFQEIHDFLVTRGRVYVADGNWPDDVVVVFNRAGKHLYTLEPRRREDESSVVRGLREDDERRLVLVRFDEKNWFLDWYGENGEWLSGRELVYEQESPRNVTVIASLWPAFAPWQVIYQKMSYSAGSSGLPGSNSGWSLSANEVWLYNAKSDEHSRLFALKDDYINATVLGLLGDDRVVMVYYQGGKMVVVPYDRKGSRGRAAALSLSQSPTRYALAPSGLLLAADYRTTDVELGWWRLDEFWRARRG